MPALCIRFQEEDWFFAWEEELENDLETATGSDASFPDGAAPFSSGVYPVVLLIVLGVIVGILLVSDWRFP